MIDAIKKRRSIRKYKDKKIEKEKIDEILKAGMFSPSAHGSRPWHFILVTDKKKKESISKMKNWSYFCDNAPLVLVLCSKKEKLWVENLAIAAENILLEAVNQGLGSCIIQVRNSTTLDNKDCEEYVRKLFAIPEDIRILFLITLGYPDEEKSEHKDQEFEKEKIHYQKW